MVLWLAVPWICFIVLCNIVHSTSFVPTDESHTPLLFSSTSYNAVLIGENPRIHYVSPLDPHLGVSEPFGGTPSGNVQFTVLAGAPDTFSFRLQTIKLGNFFFLRIYASSSESIVKRSRFILYVEATFISESMSDSTPIKLRNTTEINVDVLERNDNCPFFSSTKYQFDVHDRTSHLFPIGRVNTADADSGFNAQAFYYIDPASDTIPIWIHPFTGELYASTNFAKPKDHLLTGVPPIEHINNRVYDFKVFASQRGDSSRIRCSVVSVTGVRIDVSKTSPDSFKIIIDPFEDISAAGASGSVYALIKVAGGDTQTPNARHLTIVEPALREGFELVPTDSTAEWMLQVRRNLSTVSLVSKISLTLKATNNRHEKLYFSEKNSFHVPPQPTYERLTLPVVSKSTYRLSLPEEIILTIPETSLLNCTIAILVPNVSYPMTNSSFAFRVLDSSDHNSPFHLTTTGAVVVKQLIDVDLLDFADRNRGTSTEYSLSFSVVDRNNLLLSSTATSILRIKVQDINDNDPVVRNNASVYEIQEDAFIGMTVFRVDAIDPDVSRTTLSYVLHNRDKLPFSLSPDGELTVSNPLDAETMPDEFTIYVEVSDSGKPLPRKVLALFTVHISDVNEYAPEFVERSCDIWLGVNSQGSLPSFAGSSISLGRYSAEDADRDGNAHLKISLASSSLPRPCFSVDSTTGELTLSCSYLGPPNSKIILTLIASDGVQTSRSPCRLNIHLLRANSMNRNFTQQCEPSGIYEHIQNFKLKRKEYVSASSFQPSSMMLSNRHRPKFPSDLSTRLHVPENLPLGTAILRVSASDEDGADFSLSGQVVLGLEAVSSVHAESYGLHPSSEASQFHQAFLLRPASDQMTTKLSGGLHNVMDLVVAAPLDRESISSYSLILHACDLGLPSLCTFSLLQVFVEDLDDNPPEFGMSIVGYNDYTDKQSGSPLKNREKLSVPGVFTVPEDVPVDEFIGEVTATDKDVSNEVRYRLLNYVDFFDIDPKRGKIRLLRNLNREVQSSFELLIEAYAQTRRNYEQAHLFYPHYRHLLHLAEKHNQYVYNRSAVTRVVISVTDVNDNAPVFLSLGSNSGHHSSIHTIFSPDGYELFVPEDLPEGSYLTTLYATDADDGINAQVGYSIFGDSSHTECFHVEQFSGVVTVGSTCELTKFSGQTMHMTAWAFDHGFPQLTSNNSFTVHVIPVHINVFPPHFLKQPALYSGQIAENIAANSPVRTEDGTALRLEAVDPEGVPIDFVIFGGSGIGRFYIDDEGIIRSARLLDAESVLDEGGYWLTVYATERPLDFTNRSSLTVISTESNGPMKALAEVFIEILDENDNYPIPESPAYRTRLAENSPADLLVTTVRFTDADRTSSSLIYRISSGDPQGHFSIDSQTGAVRTTTRTLNREVVVNETGSNVLALTVTATDRGNPPRSAEVRLLVEVSDENDQRPTFVPTTYKSPSSSVPTDLPTEHMRIYEGEQDPYSGCIGRVFALDLDAGPNGSVIYWRDTSGPQPTNDSFEVDPQSGLICSSISPLAAGLYHFQVHAEDQGQPPLVDDKPITVHITVLPTPSLPDGTSYVLQFTQSPPKKHVLDTRRPVGHHMFRFSLSDDSDPDGETLTYSLTVANGSRHHPFGLRQLSATESVVFLAQPVTESTPEFQLILTVSNGHSRLVAKTKVSVEQHLEDHVTFLVDEFYSPNSVGNLTILNQSHDTGLSIQVNVSEATPVGSLLCTLKAQGRTEPLDYSVVSVGQTVTRKLFTVDQRLGELRIVQPLDSETVAVHYLLVSVRSGLATSFVAVHIDVQDVNEYMPEFPVPSSTGAKLNWLQDGVFTFFCEGTSPVGTVVGRVVAYDRDQGTDLTYGIVGGESASYFSVNPKTGEIIVTRNLLPNENTSTSLKQPNKAAWTMEHRLLVSASDDGSPISKINYSLVTVRIIPGPGGINLPPPQFRFRTIHLNLLENNRPGHVIAPISRFLTEESATIGFVHFELVRTERIALDSRETATSESELFHVVPYSGLLVALVQLDREYHGDLHRLYIRTTGMYGIRAQLADYMTVEIRILDDNDNPPRIESPKLLYGKIHEDALPGTLVSPACPNHVPTCDLDKLLPIQIRATDPDLGLNAQLRFDFVGPHAARSRQTFSIDPETGWLSLALNVRLDRESISYYTLFVQVSDEGQPSRTTENLIRIHIQVEDVNDCSPVFDEVSYLHTLVLPTYPSEVLMRVHATDPDENDTVFYRFVNDEMKRLFELDPVSGSLRVALNSTLLDSPSRLSERTFLVQVEAYDTGYPVTHRSQTNITIFGQFPRRFGNRNQNSIVIDPVGGLDVQLVEHYKGPGPLFLGQVTVRNAPIGAIFSFIVPEPIPGIMVDRFTGVVWATGEQPADALDRERDSLLNMTVLVRDTQKQLGQTTVRIHLLDVNDHSPAFIGEPYYVVFCIYSDAAEQVEISSRCLNNTFRVSAVDEDEGPAGSISYSLTSVYPRSEPPLFAINPTTGELSIDRPLSPDWAGRQLDVIVTAQDGGGLRASTTVVIHLVSANGPRFTASHYTVTVSELTPLGDALTTVEATSSSLSANLLYRVVDVKFGNGTLRPMRTMVLADSPFMLEFNTGIVRLVLPLDYESVTTYQLLLEALDTSSGLAARVYLSIEVMDVNDVRPRFPVPNYTVHVSESQPLGSVFLQLEATDPDSGYGGQILYSLEPHTIKLGNSVSSMSTIPFDCDSKTGQIRLTGPLNYTDTPVYRLWVVATDQADSPLSSRVPLTVHVLDANNNAPVFDVSTGEDCSYIVRLNEASNWGSFVCRIHAMDTDVNDTLTYQLLPTPLADYFRLSPYDGVLRWTPFRNSQGRLGSINSYGRMVNGESSPVWFERHLLDSLDVDVFDLQVQVSDGLHTTSCNVKVHLDPANWIGPEFPGSKHVRLNVSESQPLEPLGQIPPAVDGDRAQFGEIHYTLVGGFGREDLDLDEQTGELRGSIPLDRERQDRYELLLRATDGGGLFDFLRMDVNVIDRNDNRPRFLQQSYSVTLFPEDYNPPHPHFPVFTSLRLLAVDADLGANSQLHYRLFRPPTAHLQPAFDQTEILFDIDPLSGHLVLKSALPSSQASQPHLQLFVEACDAPATGYSSTLCSTPAKVMIHFASWSPSVSPTISCTSSPVLENNQLLDQDVAFCRVTPTNLTGTWVLSHVISGSTSYPGRFRIDPSSGHVFANEPMDYELGHIYDLGVEYHVTTKPVWIAARTTIKIQPIDINDCAPEFDSSEYFTQVREDVPLGTRILRVLARDADADYTDPVFYSLWPKSVLEAELAILNTPDKLAHLSKLAQTNPEVDLLRKRFAIDSAGWISVRLALDYETQKQYQFKVLAMDSVGHWNASLVTIHLLDVNDNPPHWPLHNSPNHSLDHVLFPDFLKRQLLEAVVRIPENDLPQSSIYQLEAYDPDLDVNDSITFYAVPELPAGRTHVSDVINVSPSGLVRLRYPLDREMAANYTVRFRASDGVFVTRDVFTLVLSVEDVNDHAPICIEPMRSINVPENTTVDSILTQLIAEDADAEIQNSRITYQLTSGNPEQFSVDPVTGQVRLLYELDFETVKSHVLTVSARDGGELSCQFSIVINVTDVNDNAPVFEPILINPIPENATIGSMIGKITAQDVDLVDANRLTYSLQSAHEASFAIEPQTGLLRITRNLDRETKSVHHLTVFVTDGLLSEQPAFTATASFSIQLLDVNDSPPEFLNTSSHRLHVSELAPIGKHLLRLKAVSLDEGKNAVVRYRLLTNQPEFALNETTGDLELAKLLDHERVPSYFLTVEAHDHGTPPLSSTTVVTVNVQDENDHSPEFLGRKPVPNTLLSPTTLTEATADVKSLFREYYTFSVIENSRPGTVIGRLKAVDADSGDNGRLIFQLSPSNRSDWIAHLNPSANTRQLLNSSAARDLFHIDPNSGQISLLFEPDRESIDEFWFEGVVSDHGSPNPLTNRTLISIRVLDVNDCPPAFEKKSYEFVIEVDRSGNVSGCQEIQPVNLNSNECNRSIGGRVLIGRLRLTDADADPNAGPFTCQLTHSGNVQAYFDSSRSSSLFFVRNGSSGEEEKDSSQHNTTRHGTGECLLYAMDRLPIGSQSLVLRANDNGLTALHTSVTVTVRVVRLANLPPEIVQGNMTLSYYRGSQLQDDPFQPGVRSSIQDILSTLVVGRVTVKDRTAHDRLRFELLPSQSKLHAFHVDPHDGTIRSVPSDTDAQDGKRIQLDRLDSGLYPLKVRVMNGSLSSEETIHIQVIAITDEMLQSATIIRISNLLPNLFYMEKYDARLRSRLASLVHHHQQPASRSASDTDVYILSVQEADQGLSRPRRHLDRAVDVLVAVYDPEQRDFVKPKQLADALAKVSNTVAGEFGGNVEVVHDVCTPQFCPRGHCVNRVMIDLHGLVNRVEIHRVSQVSPRFVLSPTCQCPEHFSGLRCDIPLDGCSSVSCPAPKMCIPRGHDSHECVCPPPRSGPTCESVQRFAQMDNCYTERCFVQRESGPLQFAGGSFIQWELVNPSQHHFELAFHIRTRQIAGPLVAVRWNAVRAFQIRIATGGRLVVSTTGMKDGLPATDWLVSAHPVSDGRWHRFKLILTHLNPDYARNSDSLLFKPFGGQTPESNPPSDQSQLWWVELTVDHIEPRSTFIEWEPGDPLQQGLLLGADPVHGFRPLSQPRSVQSAPTWDLPGRGDLRKNVSTDETTVIRSGITGCIRDVLVNRLKPPYQLNQRLPPNTSSDSAIVLFRTHQLAYGCDPALTLTGPCSAGPCLHGGTCTTANAGPGSYRCQCPALFHGHHCERTSDACLLQPCQNGGRCQPLTSSSLVNMPSNSGLAAYRCVCPTGVSGLHCEILHDLQNVAYPSGTKSDGPECRRARLMLQTSYSQPSAQWKGSSKTESSICLNKGVCLEANGGPRCSCPVGWYGARCEHDVDECRLAQRLFSRPGVQTTNELSTTPKWFASYGGNAGGLCSPYERGRGVCVNTPGSYNCNCSLGFTGRHCQTKNLISLTPDSNALGLSQLHVYIIVGLLLFLFLAALMAIVLLACRARGMFSGVYEANGRSVKASGPVLWNLPGGDMSRKPPSQCSDTQFYRYNHSEGSSLSGVPFLSSVHGAQHLGTHPSCHGFPSNYHHRPSLVSSNFTMPGHGDESTAPLLITPSDTVNLRGDSNAALVMNDLEDNSANGGSRLVLCPTASGDAVPVVMMMSPSLNYSGSTRSINNRACIIPHYSPASSVVLGGGNGSTSFSGSMTPVNYGNHPYMAYHQVEAPGSASIPPRYVHITSPPFAYIPAGSSQAYFAAPQHPLTPAFGLRPGSVVGSDRLSLGSGSDRFSAHGSQTLVQPNGYPHASNQTAQYLSASVESFTGGPRTDQPDRTLRPEPDSSRVRSQGQKSPQICNPDQSRTKPSFSNHTDIAIRSHSTDELAPGEGESTPTLHKSHRAKCPMEEVALHELRPQKSGVNGTDIPTNGITNGVALSREKLNVLSSANHQDPSTKCRDIPSEEYDSDTLRARHRNGPPVPPRS